MYEELDGSRHAARVRVRGATAETGKPVVAPVGYRVVEVNTESTAEVRDLASLRRDLETAKAFTEALIERGWLDQTDSRHPDSALWIAAVTLYGRAFGAGVRHAARLSTDGLDESGNEAHQFLLDLRNKHIAHSVSELEQTRVHAYLTNSAFARRSVSRVGQAFVELQSDPSEGEALIALCVHFLKDIDRRLRAAHVNVGRELWQMGEEAVYALPDLALPDANTMKVTRSRKQRYSATKT